MRKNQTKQKETPISEKVKKMFRYSPSYEAQKCYSKLPLRHSNASINTIPHTFKQNEITCQYSSVQQKNIQTNSCNDTSSWIAKLVNGIQDEDEENKNFHRLSQIQNNSVSDLPEDSQDYGYNEFLIMEQGESLFAQKQVNQNSKFDKQAPITKPMKKSIKQAMIQIQIKENKEGLRGPPVTRDNSNTKRQNYPKNKSQRQSSIKIVPRMLKNNIINSNAKQRNSLLPRKLNTQIQKKIKTVQKFTQKRIQVSKLNESCNKEERKNSKSQIDDSTIQYQTCKRSLMNTYTKKQGIQRLGYQIEEHPTRKNSFINQQDLRQSKEDFNIVEEHSKYLNMKNLFSEQNQVQIKLNHQKQNVPSFQGQVQKRIGSIKKNKTGGQDFMKIISFGQRNIKNDLNQIKISINQNVKNTKGDQNQKRESNNFTLNRKNYDQYIDANAQTDRITSNRENFLQYLQPNNRKSKNQTENHIFCIQNKVSTLDIKIQRQTERSNCEKIRSIFNKIRLDQSNEIISKNNLKLRGLSDQQKTQLGSIISKIHYKNSEYDFKTFQKEYTKMNIQCTLKGCLSQEKLRKFNDESSQRRHLTKKTDEYSFIKQIQEHQPFKRQVNEKKQQEVTKTSKQMEQAFFEQNESIERIKYDTIQGIGHRRNNSINLKKNLFNQMKRITYSDLQKPQSKQNQHQYKDYQQNVNTLNETDQNLSKDPYIQGPSLTDIQLTNRCLNSNRAKADNSKILEMSKNHQSVLRSSPGLNDENGSCLIQRLNKKLSSYIDKNHIQSTYRQFNLNFSQLKKHIR